MARNKASSLAREKLEGRVVGGKFSELANYSDLFERSHDGIAFVDVRNHEVLETNGAFRDLIETDRTLEGTTFFDFFPESDRASLENWFGQSGTTLELNTADDRVIEFTAARVKLADYCEVYQLLARDITKERVKQTMLERQSLTDEMTGLSNFRAFRTRLALEHERADKKNQPYAVVFFDVDHFKHFNDRNGHPAGDETLRRLAAILRRISGRTEFVARYGGEEFVVLVSGANLDVGREFAEKARAAIETEKFPHGEAQPLGRVTASIGVAAYEAGVAPDVVLKRADEALYESKQGGRNRVTAYVSGRAAMAYLLKKTG
ncbi:MAG: sensor domain-containing diguanylate cyclase [Bdellovibrionales bacterium]|nr:sensor domain-containing diguanylate cyclase [Bdellovibrionales bacterium]